MKVFLDASVLAKRYIREKGSEKVEQACTRADTLVVSVICLPEIVSALCRLRREKVLEKDHYLQCRRALFTDVHDMSVCDLAPQVVARAVQILENNPLRAIDALHVASAIESQADLFVSADSRQTAAARKSHLKVLQI